MVDEGPNENQPVLRFGKESWAELPPLKLDSDTPFSIAMWIYQPKVVGDFVVAGQYDPDDDSRGWSIGVQERRPTFKMTGEKAAGQKKTTRRENFAHQAAAYRCMDAHCGDPRRLRRACRPALLQER